MSVIDISVTLHPKLVAWPNGIGFSTSHASRIAAGDDANVTIIYTNAHMGTHVDAPLHFIDGTRHVAELELSRMVGACSVLDFRGHRIITAQMLQQAKETRPLHPRLLFKTDNSALWHTQNDVFYSDYCALTADAAQWAVANDIQLLGIDYLSIQRYEDSFETHRIILRKEIVILEGLDLSQVQAGDYMLCCLPLKIQGADGAPARAILMPL
ncbi:MAG: cyclase family protein [Cytophagales bacterium]|nr:cyclase family protein [Bernardetiaceae bacterium]MDW8205676.1 cyclase family protein [Cytophagales bacterium]